MDSPPLSQLYSQQSTVQLPAYGDVDDIDFDVEQADTVLPLPDPEPGSTPTASTRLIQKPAPPSGGSKSKFYSFQSFIR